MHAVAQGDQRARTRKCDQKPRSCWSVSLIGHEPAYIFVNLIRTSQRNRLWPLVASIALLITAIAFALAASMRQNAGHLVYALDDPYIHMAMAKNAAIHHVWGVSATHFTSSSSSLLWTAALALLFATLGIHEIIPFVVNMLVAVVLLAVAFREVSRDKAALPTGYQFVILAGVALCAPLPGLVFVGQEHILHSAVNLMFVAIAASFVNAGASSLRDPIFRRLCVLAFCLPLIRYEALFAVAIVSIILIAQRRWLPGTVLGIAGIAPVALYGAVSKSLGWYWLPNSVLLKGARPDLSSLHGIVQTLGYVSYSRLIALPALAFLFYAALAAFALKLVRGDRDDLQWMLGIFIAVTLLHTQFAQPQAFWFFRYEAYLIVLGCVVVGRALGQWLSTCGRETWTSGRAAALDIAVLLLFALSPLPDRAAKALVYLPQATTNIYEQQYQMGLFLKQFYEGIPVALNDIGAASFLGDIECIDLLGLANMDVARMRLRGVYESEDIQQVVQASSVPIAIVYDSRFGNAIPGTWRRAGTWTIRKNIVGGSDTVTFYATNPGAFGSLRSHLVQFSQELPPTVIARFQ